MSRQRYIAVGNKWMPVEEAPAPEPLGPMIIPDLPAYESPIDGHIVEGRRARREDLKRNHARPYEGLEQERKEAQRQQQYVREREEQILDRVAHETYYQLAPSKRDALRKIR